MPTLDNHAQQELLQLLTPLMEREDERRGLLAFALGQDAPILGRIDFKGPVEPFILKMLPVLASFGEIEPGKQALWALLEVARERVGGDLQVRIEALRPLINIPSQPAPSATEPAQPASPQHLRVFLASPGDVADERALALKVLEQLQYDPLLRGQITLETVAWDKPGGGTPMLATLTPQAAIAKGLPKPSQCDIVIVIFWSRMGTPLPAGEYTKPDGGPYRSGTEWEYHDALQAAERYGKPEILVYRRSETLKVDLSDPDLTEKQDQWRKVEAFFESCKNPDGSIRRGYNTYSTPDAFERDLNLHLRDLIRRLLDSRKTLPLETARAIAPALELPLWQGSPFPGLNAFTEKEAPIFFGRGRETDGLVHRLANSDSRFVAVVGASGSGKSSLVAAGLLPRLRDNAIEGSKDWFIVPFKPGDFGDDPFPALAAQLKPLVENTHWRERDIVDRLRSNDLAELLDRVFENRPNWVELLLFIDQFEELFTLVDPSHCGPFIDLLAAASKLRRVRIVATMRADFYPRCLEWPKLTELLRAGSYPLAAPSLATLFEMITGPTARAGLVFEDGLSARILEDTGTEPGALALMAFALSELYEARSDGRLTHAAYEDFDGVQGAIGKRAQDTFDALDSAVQATLSSVFQELVGVDERGVATRRRAPLSRVKRSAEADRLVDAFTDARLLVTGRSESGEAVVEVAHEALLRSWPGLAAWIEDVREDLHLLRQISLAAAEWDRCECKSEFLWPHERLVTVSDMLERLHPDLNDAEQAFLKPENERLLEELNDRSTTHQRRAFIGDRLAEIGDIRPGIGLDDSGLPAIEWCDVPGGKVTLEKGVGAFTVKPFRIAKYPVTWAQYRVFLKAQDGYQKRDWWKGLADRKEEPGEQFRPVDNHPADTVSWYDAVAYCCWLSAKLNYEVRLPTEWEWQQAAMGGDPTREYPWGAEWDSSFANTSESRLSRTTAVGMYPHGASSVGALDMSGNVWEWCVNEYDKPKRIKLAGTASRVLRGGSWSNLEVAARAASRRGDPPDDRYGAGFRLVRASPMPN